MIYEDKSAEEFAAKIDFAKMGGLVPAVAQDAMTRRVLMVAFMDKDALVKTLTSGYAHYFSRSRKKLWKKGEESGNAQKVISVKADCDNDTILLSVEQTGPACHSGEETCFGGDGFGILDLVKVIEGRKTASPDSSYTARLLNDKKLAIAKVLEEAAEFAVAAKQDGKKEQAWEACDLLYHALALSAACGIGLSEIEKELQRRRSAR